MPDKELNIFYDIGVAVETYWQSKFGDNVTIHLAMPDERVVNTQDTELTYPRVAMSYIGASSDSMRRYAGLVKEVEKDTEAGTASLTDPPIPINIDFQMDLLAATRISMFDLKQTVLRVLGPAYKETITTKQERTIHLMPLPENYDFEDKNPEGLWRCAYRFRIRTWLESVEEAQEVSLVLTTILEINNQTIESEGG